MVRMVAITASLAMSSQVGATAVRTRSAAKGKLKREQNPSREPDPDLPPLHLVGGFSEDRRNHSGKGLHSAEGNDEHGASLDEERDIARNRAELFFK
jgi:hypothetical protein